MATRPKAVIESRNGEKFSPITIAKNVLTDDGQNLHDILSDRKEDMMTPTIENSSSMFKVGQGDNVDYSSNVVNGAYESMVLKGKTMVNCIQESSSQDVVLPYEFEEGQYVTINDTKESGALGVELKGQTLVNATGEPIVNLVINSSSPKYLNKNILKKDTVYTFIYDIEEVTGGASGSWGRFNYTDGTYKNVLDKQYTTGITKVATSFNKDLNNLYICWIRSHVEGQSVKLRSLMILEGDWTNKELPPYFTGMVSCKMPILRTVGKNLFDGEIELGSIDVNSGEPISTTTEIRSKNFTPINGTPFVISRTDSSGSLAIRYYDTNKNYLGTGDGGMGVGGTSRICTPPTNARYVKFKDITANLSQKVQIEYNTSATSYEPYKSSILSLPEEVVLRSLPNGVCDTFNTRTGVYTQRIGEVVLNGSEDWTNRSSDVSSDTVITYSVINLFNYGFQKTSIHCDKYVTLTKVNGIKGAQGAGYGDKECLWLNHQQKGQSPYVYINIAKAKLSDTSLNTFKSYLQSNPITVQYELETPIVTKVNLSSTLKSWNTTTHIYSKIPENSLYPILAHSNPIYPVILKPSTKYSIVANSYSNNHTNSAINFNLGGATASTTVGNRVTTITTPSTLSNELLTMSGRGNKLNNVMVIEGDVVGDEPYFEAMCDVKSPVLTNTGKNLFNCTNVEDINNSYTVVNMNNQNYITTDTLVEKGKQYTLSLHANISGATGNVLSLGYMNYSNIVGGVEKASHNIVTIDSIVDKTTSITFTAQTTDYIKIYIATGKVGYNAVLSNVQIEEGSVATSYEPYKSNILSCNGDKIELTEDMFEQGTTGEFSANIGATYHSFKSDSNNRIRTKEIVKVKPNTTYSVICNNGYTARIAGFDINGLCLSEIKSFSSNTTIITTSNNVHYICVILSKISGSISTLDFLQSGLEIREVDKTIVLRSLPNGVCDTLNVETGEYVQRIGEVMFDSSENWVKNIESNSEVSWYHYNKLNGANDGSATNLICDRLTVTNQRYPYSVRKYTNGKELIITVPTSIANNVTDFKTWLSQNPVTIQYELAEPIVKTVDLSGFPYAYANGHVQLSSGSIEQSLTPKVEYSVVTNRNGQIRSNQKMVERHQKQLDRLQAMILTNLVNTQYEQALTNLKYNLKNVREEVK